MQKGTDGVCVLIDPDDARAEVPRVALHEDRIGREVGVFVLVLKGLFEQLVFWQIRVECEAVDVF